MAEAAKAEFDHLRLRIHPWPKMVYLWPTMFISFAMAIAERFMGQYAALWGFVFMVVFGLNLMVLTFDFPRGTSLTLAFAVIATVLVLFLANYHFEVIGPLARFFKNRKMSASSEFYVCLFLVQVILFVGMYVVTRFDYWELTPNELLHHRGVLGDMERYPTAGLKFNKEITDFFEYILCGSGTLTLHLPSSPRPIVLENILRITRVERVADRLLDANLVRMESPQVAKREDVEAITGQHH